jgi:hypothetical protein
MIRSAWLIMAVCLISCQTSSNRHTKQWSIVQGDKPFKISANVIINKDVVNVVADLLNCTNVSMLVRCSFINDGPHYEWYVCDENDVPLAVGQDSLGAAPIKCIIMHPPEIINSDKSEYSWNAYDVIRREIRIKVPDKTIEYVPPYKPKSPNKVSLYAHVTYKPLFSDEQFDVLIVKSETIIK